MSSFIIGVDTGGTFTDVFAAKGSEARWTKVWTTHHDLTVCLMEGVQQIAALWDLSVRELLSRTELVRYGTTVGTNALIQKSGPKLGVIVTRPFETDLYSPDATFPKELAALVRPDMVFGIGGEADPSGEVTEWPDDEEVRSVVEKIIDLGARAVIVSLRGAAANRAVEQRVKRVILEERPPQYLGSAPHFLGSAVSATPDDFRRTSTAIVNAYLHRDMVRYLYKAEDNLRNQGLRRPLLVTHCTGGVAKVAKTIALHTYGSGPVACLLGCARMASDAYGLKDFVSIDIGGTSVDIGVVKDAQTSVQRQPVVEGVALDMPMVYVRSVPGGGGAIARLMPGGQLSVGPDSAGNLPGPAAYQLGGTAPTVCDAQLVLGYLDPDYYFGGKKKLDRQRAADAIRKRIAGPNGQTIEQAALAILQRQEEEVAIAIGEELKARRVEPEQLALFVAGGNGGLHCCSYAALLNIPRVIASRTSAVASAFGASLMDVVHIYRQGARLSISRGGPVSAGEASAFNDALSALIDKARRDTIGEGLDVAELRFQLEAEVQGPDGPKVVQLPFLVFDPARSSEVFDLYSGCARLDGAAELSVTEICLRAISPIPHYQLTAHEHVGSDAAEALKGERPVHWPEGAVETRIYERDRLCCGNQIEGPAIIESPDTTQLVPSGWLWTVDKFLNGVIERKGP